MDQDLGPYHLQQCRRLHFLWYACMNSCLIASVNTAQTIVHSAKIFPVHPINLMQPESHPFSDTNMQLQNEFHLHLFCWKVNWTRDITLNHGKRRWSIAWSATEMTFLGLNQPLFFCLVLFCKRFRKIMEVETFWLTQTCYDVHELSFKGKDKGLPQMDCGVNSTGMYRAHTHTHAHKHTHT